MREKETDTSCPQCSIFHFLAAIRAVVHSATSRKVFNAKVVIGPKITEHVICNVSGIPRHVAIILILRGKHSLTGITIYSDPKPFCVINFFTLSTVNSFHFEGSDLDVILLRNCSL